MPLNSHKPPLSAALSWRGWQWSFLIVAVALSLFSCNRRSLYSHFEPVAAAGWSHADTLHFTVTPPPVWFAPQVAGRSVLFLNLRTTSAYPYTDLLLFVVQRTGSMQRHDTLRLKIADSEGRSLGSGQGLYQHTFRLRGLPIDEDDTLRVDVVHVMQRSPLPGVIDVGLALEAEGGG